MSHSSLFLLQKVCKSLIFRYEGPDRYFEKKSKFKKQIMLKLTNALDLNLASPKLVDEFDWDIAEEQHLIDDEGKAPSIINE